ncbi:hypothetical protein Ahy_A04g020416 [Arachis hypogaea]|uniref:Zinc finger GRF-type domain-containing protein n=1 Tax=Arachis hypogaea TaxID=3818 RepID=A0A445DHU2_ARAHY|nr:hypothetical protein Ahy_A04g020416 [Arachis hypogaea]
MVSGGSTSVASRRRGRKSINDVVSVDSSSTGFPKGRFKRGEHPKYRCRTYVVISRSLIAEKSNTLFFGCPHFKEKQGYCDFFVWFDEIFGYLVDDVVENSRLASVEICVGEIFVVGLNFSLEERIKQLEEMLIKKKEDSPKLKKDSVFRLFRGVIIGALVVVILFCIYVVVI